MRTGSRFLPLALVGLVIVSGCSSAKGPKLAAADGTVNYQGKPLAGVTVMLIPEKGQIANGVTGADGKFVVSTGATRGVAVGRVTVSLTTAGPGAEAGGAKRPQTQAENDEYMKKAAEMQAAMAAGTMPVVQSKSTFPEKYSKADTSGLAYTIKENGDNHFTIDLVD